MIIPKIMDWMSFLEINSNPLAITMAAGKSKKTINNLFNESPSNTKTKASK